MHLRATLLGFFLVIALVFTAQGSGYVWTSPGDLPEMTLEQFQRMESHPMSASFIDETDDSTGYNVTHYNLEIKFDPSSHSVSGKVDMQFTVNAGPISFVNLNLNNNMIVDSARVNGSPVTSSFIGANGLRLTLGSPLPQGANATSTIYYHGNPISGSWPNAPGLNWNTHLGTYIIWSLSEPDGARSWWPCKDMPSDKATARMVWTVPSNLYATSNGNLLGVTVPQVGWKSYEWVENHLITTYLIPVTATNFAHFRNWYVTTGGDSMPIDNYVYPEDSLDAVSDFADINQVIGFFASVFGEYSFLDEKYGHSAFPWSGGMEHQTNTSIGANLITGTGTYHWIYVHELAHEWWGDMLTCASWSDIWTQEGFATYCDALWIQHAQGQAAFNTRMSSFRQQYFSGESSEGRFPISNPTNPNQEWGVTVYEKGGWILHMLRYVMGEQTFWNFWPVYRETYCPGNVPGNTGSLELQTTMQQVSGQDLSWFFNEWVWTGTHYPEYQWNYQTVAQGGNTRVNLYIHQNQTLISGTPIFNMPIQIKLNKTVGLPDSVVIWDSQQNQYFSFLTSGTVSGAPLFDNNEWILKTKTTIAYPAPTWTILVTPQGGPIVIPARGGNFTYDLNFTNNTTNPLSGQIWVMQRGPNGVWTGPMLGPVSVTIPAGATVTRHRGQNVPGSAAPGLYYYEGRAGTYPNTIVACSNFTYTKMVAGEGPEVNNWANFGESFDLWMNNAATQTPDQFALQGAYPNPFNPSTTIRFTLPEAAQVKLAVYDVSGRCIWSLSPASAQMSAGSHEVTFDGAKLPSGVYLYSLSAGANQATGKMVLLK